ncbi:sialidase family protein [Streptoalloteichus hindustanus]|uniref:Photosynthesis system II assembly factor Ycf48/Hcf136-like domain-containing protein n=1 Tax=Streptoalloteichus hindustanus TaxID=2017 RepID=A0A1M4YKA8_STRHI|nr:hypothetical protein [Streptoalloteichus hindustanus]SHF06170.1 hypothetical protein SAMN05444320_102391 [Streptoalloteichus hindustanus]
MAAPGEFVPTSTSWTSAERGWVLGFAHDDTTARPVLLSTEDGGARWTRRNAPDITVSPISAQVRVHLANDRDALATNGEILHATHDGAASWHPVELPDARPPVRVEALATNGASAYALVISGAEDDRRTRLFASPVDQSRWAPVPGLAAPGVAGGSVVGVGSAAFVVIGGGGTPGRYWTTEDGSDWREADPPCAEPEMATWLALVPGDRAVPSAVFAVCAYRAELPPGQSHKDLRRSTGGGPFELLGRAPTTGIARGLAVPAPDTALVASVGGGFAFLFRTTDGGRTWDTVLRQEPPEFLDLAFQDTTHGVVFRGSGTGSHGAVLRTTDGGVSWRELSFGEARPATARP